jgi:hypothetical protein
MRPGVGKEVSSTGMVVGLDHLFFSVKAQVDGQLGLSYT